MKLSILDQSPVSDTITSAEAVRNSIDLAERADSLGYHRYWFAEHHGNASFASATPEVMMAYAAARTKRIRLGSGGILLGHAVALKTTEAIRLLEALAPGRVDAGFGRAPGGDARAVRALRTNPNEAYPRLEEILNFLRDMRPASNNGSVVAVPDGVSPPEVWVLGTTADSARTAARLGLRYAFGAFIDPSNANEALAVYHSDFVPSQFCTTPTTMVATVVFCADTDAKAQELSRTTEQWFVRNFLRAGNDRFITNSDTFTMSDREQMIVAMRRKHILIGEPKRVADGLQAMASRYATEELSVVTITHDHDSRVKSYELIAASAL
ncbi:MAG: LLM class flavin-dependent oxidoreductase [bacterium]|nr:LLM class flavin-dependent oxidoreductase [bacterium]